MTSKSLLGAISGLVFSLCTSPAPFLCSDL